MRRGKAVPVVLAAMALIVSLGAAALAADAPVAPPPPATQPEVMPPDPVDNFQGDYDGTYNAHPSAKIEAKVVAEGKGNYRAIVGMPFGKGGPKDQTLVLNGKQDGARVLLTGSMPVYALNGTIDVTSNEGMVDWTGKIEGGHLVAVGKGGRGAGTLDLKHVVKKSPTEGAKPPAGAVVLLPYEPGKPTRLDAWANKNWKVLPDGSAQVFKGNNKTVAKFGDCRLHVEFRCPYMPDARGQGRGNSGVYLQNRYEVQVLDSFGLPAKDNECGGIYRVSTPKVNASLPPLSWQTFDITFRAPRLDPAGKRVEPAVISVEHNGVLIHDKVQMKGQTGGGAGGAAAADVILLQDHGNAVRYRNIWLVELKAEPAAASKN